MVIWACGDFLMFAGGCNKACVTSPTQSKEHYRVKQVAASRTLSV